MGPHARYSPARAGIFSLFALLVAVQASFATQVLYRTPEQLGRQSTLVVRGTVSATQSFWNQTHTKIFTEVSVNVDETYKGGTTRSVRLLQLGGTVDDVKMTVQGALLWRPDEEVLLFLEPYVSGSYTVSGFSQGKYEIERDADTKKPYVRHAAQSDAQLVGAPSAQVAETDRESLDRFVNRALGRKGGSR